MLRIELEDKQKESQSQNDGPSSSNNALEDSFDYEKNMISDPEVEKQIDQIFHENLELEDPFSSDDVKRLIDLIIEDNKDFDTSNFQNIMEEGVGKLVDQYFPNISQDQKILFIASFSDMLQYRIDIHLSNVIPASIFRELDVLLAKEKISEEQIIATVILMYYKIRGESIFKYTFSLAPILFNDMKEIFKDLNKVVENISELPQEDLEKFSNYMLSNDFESAKKIVLK